MPIGCVERPRAEEQVARVHQRCVERFDLLLVPRRTGVALESDLPAGEERAETGQGGEGGGCEDDEVGRQRRGRGQGDRQGWCDQGREGRKVRDDQGDGGYGGGCCEEGLRQQGCVFGEVEEDGRLGGCWGGWRGEEMGGPFREERGIEG